MFFIVKCVVNILNLNHDSLLDVFIHLSLVSFVSIFLVLQKLLKYSNYKLYEHRVFCRCEFILAHCKNPKIGLVHEGECSIEATPPPTLMPDDFCQNLLKQTCHGVRPICGTNGVDYDNE